MLLSLAADSDSGEVFYQCATVHDILGRETEAVPYYEKAIQSGLAGEDLRGAFLGLGSTYRCLGEYERASAILQQGVDTFPQDHALKVFLAMAKYNLKDCEEAVKILLHSVVETSSSADIKTYSRAITFYAERLNEVFK